MLISLTKPVAGQRPPRLSFSASLNRQAQDGFVPRSVEDATKGLSFRDALKVARPETDRVTSPERVNPASDALLLNLVDKLPVDLFRMTRHAVARWFVKGDAAPDSLREKVVQYKIGDQCPIDMTPLMQTLVSVMKETPQFTPFIGPEHEWSAESKNYQGVGFYTRVGQAILGERPLPFPTFSRSKLVCALGLGATNIVMPTGKEAGLKEWMLAQDSGSIELHDLFRQAYTLNEGDLYGTLLTAENVLCEGLYDPDRQNRELTKHLSYLRSDSAPKGDHFGSWYHLIGAALYSLVRPEWKAGFVMKVEAAGSVILEGSDAQEDYINELGVQLGQNLRKVAKQGLPSDSVPAHPYINLREFGWNRRSVAHFTVPHSKS